MNKLLHFLKILHPGVAGISCLLADVSPKRRIVKGLSGCADISPL